MRGICGSLSQRAEVQAGDGSPTAGPIDRVWRYRRASRPGLAGSKGQQRGNTSPRYQPRPPQREPRIHAESGSVELCRPDLRRGFLSQGRWFDPARPILVRGHQMGLGAPARAALLDKRRSVRVEPHVVSRRCLPSATVRTQFRAGRYELSRHSGPQSCNRTRVRGLLVMPHTVSVVNAPAARCPSLGSGGDSYVTPKTASRGRRGSVRACSGRFHGQCSAA